jgi:tetratricopeptide (TPR) repeat protein
MKRPWRTKLFLGCLVYLALAFNLHSSWAQEANIAQGKQIFYQGNADYKAAKFEAAVDSYLKVLNLGLASSNLYYNLGNSYFKKGNLGKAALNYERALMIMPDDRDLRSNYAYVLARLNLDQQSFGNWLKQASDKLFQDVTINFLTVLLALINLLVFLALMISLIFDRAKRGIKFLVSFLLAVFVMMFVALSSKIVDLHKGGVVVVQEALVKFEPREEATTYFKLSEGSKVKILDKIENWYKIKRADGKIGWMAKDNLDLILDL